MQKSNWREEIKNPEQLDEFIGGIASAGLKAFEITQKSLKKGIGKTAAGKPQYKKSDRLQAARDRDGDGKLERKQKDGEFQETLLYDVVHDYIIAENFASDTKGANKVMLKLSDELMQEIYERMMTASEKRKDTMLKKKYDDSDMKKNMQAQYGKEEGKKVYFATIRKQAMKKEEYISEVPALAAIPAAIGKGAAVVGKAALGAAKVTGKVAAKTAQATGKAAVKGTKAVGKAGLEGLKAGAYAAGETVAGAAGDIAAAKMRKKFGVEEEVEVVNELSKSTLLGYVQKGTRDIATRSNDASIKGMAGKRKEADKGYEKVAKRVAGVKKAAGKLATEEVGITTHSMMMKNKAKKEAMIRMKERDAVAKKLRKEEMSNGDKVVKMAKAVTDEKKRKNALQIQKYIGEVKRDEYGDPIGGPKISKKEKEKNLKKNTPDEQHTTTTSEGYGSDRVGPALTMARVIDKVNPKPKPTSKRTRISRALKLASIKKDEKIRKRQENPYSADKRLKMVATSIRDRVKQKAKAMTTREDYIPEEGYDIARDMGRVPKTKDKKDATTMPPSKEMEKTRKVYKGPSALELVKKKYGKAIMDVKKK